VVSDVEPVTEDPVYRALETIGCLGDRAAGRLGFESSPLRPARRDNVMRYHKGGQTNVLF
jgi:hypothetical protein